MSHSLLDQIFPRFNTVTLMVHYMMLRIFFYRWYS